MFGRSWNLFMVSSEAFEQPFTLEVTLFKIAPLTPDATSRAVRNHFEIVMIKTLEMDREYWGGLETARQLHHWSLDGPFQEPGN